MRAHGFSKTPILGFAAVLILSLSVVVGCNNNQTPATGAAAFSIIDDSGATVSFDKPVETIVSMAPSNTEIIYFVGAGSKLIGRTDYCNYPPEVASVPSIGGYSNPDKEQIVILNPDVVLATGAHILMGDVQWLKDHGLKVVVMEPKDIDGIMNDIVIVGELVGGKAIAEQKVDALEARVGHVVNSIAHLSTSSGVLFVTWHDPLWTQGDGAFMDSVIKLSGGTNIFSDVAGDAQVDIELAVTRNPQVIIVTGSMGSDTMSYDYIIAADSLFKATDAYKNDKIMLLDGDLATRPSHRLVDTLELVAKFLYPEIFS